MGFITKLFKPKSVAPPPAAPTRADAAGTAPRYHKSLTRGGRASTLLTNTTENEEAKTAASILGG